MVISDDGIKFRGPNGRFDCVGALPSRRRSRQRRRETCSSLADLIGRLRARPGMKLPREVDRGN